MSSFLAPKLIFFLDLIDAIILVTKYYRAPGGEFREKDQKTISTTEILKQCDALKNLDTPPKTKGKAYIEAICAIAQKIAKKPKTIKALKGWRMFHRITLLF